MPTSARTLIILAAGLALVAAPQAAAATHVKSSAAVGRFGRTITVSGSGFSANSEGFVSIGRVRARTVRTNAAGAFTARMQVPLAAPGRRLLRAVIRVPGTGRVRRATSPFTVRPGIYRVEHVVWIVMENKSADQIVGSADAPYVTTLARRFGNAANMTAATHPSLPNYIAMTTGVLDPTLSDSGPPSAHPLTMPSIFGQLNGDWRALQESMPSNCLLTDSGRYAVRHNPAAYFTSLRSECATNDVPLRSAPNISARFTFVTPDLCSDTHDCPVRTGDQWLAAFVPKLLRSPQYAKGRTVVFITWDESDGTAANRIATVVIAPTVRSVTRTTAFSHYSMLRTTEELLHLPLLGAAATAPSMRGAFGL